MPPMQRLTFYRSLLSISILCLLSQSVTAEIEPQYDQGEIPSFWKSKVEEIETAVHQVQKGNVKVVAHSPGGRPVYLVSYGPQVDLKQQANYNSAIATRNIQYFANKTGDTPPIVFIIGPPHGHEVEGMVGTVNLLYVAETGKDLRGKEWPRLKENFEKCRVLIIPLANPDGRARCPYDSFVGIPIDEMTRVGQGTREDGTPYGWPGAKQRHPMVGDVGILGAYFNDDGINLMHDEWFAPMAEETKALFKIAREEAPDYTINLHSHGSNPEILATAYAPRFHKEIIADFAERLMQRYQQENLPAGRVPQPKEDGETYPPPSFNLTSALHQASGGVSMLFECPHGVKEIRYPQVTHDQILDLQLLLYEELLAYAVENPRSYKTNKD